MNAIAKVNINKTGIPEKKSSGLYLSLTNKNLRSIRIKRILK